MPEQWKPIPSFPLYEASNLGRIRSWKKRGNAIERRAETPHILKPGRCGRPGGQRLCVHPTKNGKAYTQLVHRLVLEAFAGLCPQGMEACHYDGNADNNCLDNLRWDTHMANEQDRMRHGHSGKGEQNSQARLTQAQVVCIRQRYAEGESCLALGKDFGVACGTITKIVTGKRWKHAGGPTHQSGKHLHKRPAAGQRNYFVQHPEMSLGSNNGRAILNEQKVRDIRKRAEQGESAKLLAQEHSVTPSTIHHVIARISWKHVD